MADDTAPLASFSLTHVFYDPTDPVSHACAWLALLPQCLCVVYATLAIATREAEVALMFAGQLGCEAVNFALKRLIKEQRPATVRFHGKGYGMPSSHAQFVAFWAVAVGLFLLVRHQPRRDERSSLGVRILASAGAVVLAAAVACSRVYLGYHTSRQVMVGAGAGAFCAVAWFVAVSVLRAMGVVDAALQLPPARWLRVRDLLTREDLCQAGWEKWEVQRAMVEAKKDK